MRLFLLTLFIFLLTSCNTNTITRKMSMKGMEQYEVEQGLGIYKIAKSRSYNAGLNNNKCVLLLHGFVSSPDAFKYLYPELEKYKISYLAPRITGFGRIDFSILNSTTVDDWLLNALESYDVLLTFCPSKKIDLIGHSNGGVLATILAQHRKIDNLILIDPNFSSIPEDKKNKKMLNNPILGPLMETFMPVIKKPIKPTHSYPVDICDTERARKSFVYKYVPMHSLKVLWEAQDRPIITPLKTNSVYLLIGEKDLTIDINGTKQKVADFAPNYTYLSYPNSAHLPIFDYDKNQAVKDIISIVSGKKVLK